MDSNEQNHQIPNSKSSLPADDSHQDLYTIPISSDWFAWDSIHDTERTALREFFDGSSFARTPRIYKEYRDFIITKFREDPSRRLLFTDVRKALVGDVCLLRKVFSCLENWGLINFNVGAVKVVEEESKKAAGEYGGDSKVRVEEGAPTGARVVAAPNSAKPLLPPPLPVLSGAGCGRGGGVVDNGFKLPLASYSDVFGNPTKEKEREFYCGNCKEKCDSSKCHQSIQQENYVVCQKCFENGTLGENRSIDDFKPNDPAESKGNESAIWSEAETLLLLESVVKHGDDWELVAQYVQTKTKQECISRLIELPFGELMLGPHAKCSTKSTTNSIGAVEPQQVASSVTEEIAMIEDGRPEEKVDEKQNGEAEVQVPPVKKQRITLDPDKSLMKQVAIISSMVSPRVTVAAADAAVLALCDGNPLVADIFCAGENSSGKLNPEMERGLQPDDSEVKGTIGLQEIEGTAPVKDSIPLALRMRASVATALGVAASHAKLLADQEERETENLMAIVVETQLKKVRSKIKHFEELERIMEKEEAQLGELKESIIAERVDVLRKILSAGIPRWRDNSLVRPQLGND